MRVSMEYARRLLTARGYKVGPVKIPVSPAARALAKAKREHFEIALGLQLDRAGIVYERQLGFLDGRAFRADFSVEDARLLVEVDGALYAQGRHSRGAGREADMERDALAMVAGWRVLRVSPGQVTSGKALAWVKAILERWRG